MFSSYLENPTNCYFEGQDADEDILLLLRAHPITNLPWIFWALVLSFLPLFLPDIILLTGFNFSQIPGEIVNAFYIINYLVVLVIVFEGFLYWYFNVYILTNKRLIDIDFHSILFKNVDIAPLQQVQEASGSVAGLLGLTFNYGNVMIQTAGAKVAIDFDSVPNPTKVADIIMDEVHKAQNPGGGP